MIILEDSYVDYEVACTLLSTKPLYLRRTQMCINFAKKGIKRENSLFIKASKNIYTRSVKKQVKEFNFKTRRYQNSSVPYLSKLLNSQ